jgi:hypothetical protein
MIDLLSFLSSGLGSEVLEPLGCRKVGNAKAIVIERCLQGLRRVGVLNVRTVHGRIDEGDNAAEFRRGGKGGVTAEGRNGLGKRVEVLLSGD